MTNYSKIITRNEIDNIEEFNLLVIREAVRQAELKIQDENARKERIDKRVFALMSLYITVLGFVLTIIKLGSNNYSLVFVIVVPILMFGIFKLLKILKSQYYAPMGTDPITWLNKEFIRSHEDKENQDVLCHILAHVLSDIQQSLESSYASNELRIKILNEALSIGVLSISILSILFIFC